MSLQTSLNKIKNSQLKKNSLVIIPFTKFTFQFFKILLFNNKIQNLFFFNDNLIILLNSIIGPVKWKLFKQYKIYSVKKINSLKRKNSLYIFSTRYGLLSHKSVLQLNIGGFLFAEIN